jgi:ribosomal protein L6P/L9E
MITKILELPSFTKVYSITHYTKYNYIIFFSYCGFLKYKFNKYFLNVSAYDDKYRLSGHYYSLFKTYLVIIDTIIQGIKYEYNYYLKIIGLGFKYKLYKNCFYFILGFSHILKVNLIKNIFIKLNKKKKTIHLKSHDRFLLKFFIYFLKKLRPLDAYKAKGIRFKGEVIITKVGKKSMY